MPEIRLLDRRELWGSERFAFWEERFATPSGPVTRPVVHHPGAVAILAPIGTEAILLVRQYRYSLRRETLEIPAGTLRPGEEPAAGAGRELAEETGYRATGELEELTAFHPAPGVSDERMHLFFARDPEPGPADPDEGEFIAARPYRRDEVAAAAAARELDAKTLLACVWMGWAPAVAGRVGG